MIRVNRGPEPVSFAVRSTNWLQSYQEALRLNPNLTPNQFWSGMRRKIQPDAEELFRAFHGKCAFCESRPTHVSAPHIEHYRPKSKFPELMFVWQNWLLSCGRCNDKKWAHFPDCAGQPCLLDPTIEDPNLHFDFLSAQILPKTSRGNKTIQIIGLDRPPLVEERARWLMTIDLLLLLVCHVPIVYTEARELLIWCMQPDAPYTAMTCAYLRKITPRLANPDIPHPFIEPRDQIKRIAHLVEKYQGQLLGLE